MRRRATLGVALLVVVGCAASPDAATANESCQTYLASTNGTHKAVTRHIAAILRAGAIDASATPGTYSVTPVKKVIKSLTPAQIDAAEGLATTACRGASSSSVLSATVNATGTGRIKTPDVFFNR